MTASVAGANTSPTFNLTNTAGMAASIAVVSGSGQERIVVNTTFAYPLVVAVTDQYGNPVPTATVTFTAPMSSASASFSGGNTTNSSGQLAETFTAKHDTARPLPVTASVAGANTSPTFNLTNTAGMAASIAVISGSGQSTVVNTTFAYPLVVAVTDQYGNPVPTATVTFTAPMSERSSPASAAATPPTAVASPGGTVTANSQPGSYWSSASVAGVSTPATFNLTNIARTGLSLTITAVSGSGQSTPVNTGFAQPLVVKVTHQFGNAVGGVNIKFSAPPRTPAAASATARP